MLVPASILSQPLSWRDASAELEMRAHFLLPFTNTHIAQSPPEGCSEGRIVGPQADDTAGEATAGVAGSLAGLALRADLAAVALAEIVFLRTTRISA